MNKITKLVWLFLGMLILNSCKHDPILPNGNINPPSPVDTTTSTSSNPCDTTIVYFQNQVFPIIASNCAIPGCHDAITAEEDIILNSYDNIMNSGEIKVNDPSDSKIYKVLIDNDPDDIMPPPSTGNTLTSDQINIIYNWIAEGALNNYCDNSSSPCDSVNISYSGDIFPIIQQNCLGCHSNGTANGGIILETHSGVSQAALNGPLFQVINHVAGFPMMPPNGSKLDNCSILKIKTWIDAGAPNN